MFTKVRSLLLTAFIKTLGRTIRLEGAPMSVVNGLKNKGKPLLYALWHEATFCCFYFYRNKHAGIFIDDSVNGKVLGNMAKALGFTTFTVAKDPESRQTIKGTIQLIKYLREGHDGVIALDGPSGPVRTAKPGILTIAEKAGAVIVPVQVRYRHKITLPWRWDRYQIPLPFSRCSLTHGTPVEVDATTGAVPTEELLRTISERATPIS